MTIHEYVPPIDHVKEGIITALWAQGLDTCEIAHKTSLREWQVYNLLVLMKEGKHPASRHARSEVHVALNRNNFPGASAEHVGIK